MTIIVRASAPMFVLFSAIGCSSSDQSAATESSTPNEARISFVVDRGIRLEYVLKEPNDIEELLTKPLSKATKDASKRKYALLGTMKILGAHGECASYALFDPFGHYKMGDEYFVADLSQLANRLGESLKIVATQTASR